MTLEELNALDKTGLNEALFKCCGSTSWVNKMAAKAPYKSLNHLVEESENVWHACEKQDWLEAFRHHPKIGDINSLREKFHTTNKWAEKEQSGVKSASEDVLEQLNTGNRLYEEKFGFIFIVCATGKSAKQMLEMLQARLKNTIDMEIMVAMEEQDRITKLRLQKLLDA